MNVIQRLPPEIVARIAAGEVVERPASVLKELVENALDARASRISADIDSGGVARLRVSDDGSGMTPGDLSLAVQPHATSKLADADQLHALETLGFRGEALPSIASVSHFSIVSRKRPSSSEESSDESAWRIDVDGGRPEVPEPKPAAGPYGTTVEARELFYNLPARQKFLKGLASEASACADTFLILALTRPDVAFSLRQGRSELLALPAAIAAHASAASLRPSRAAQAAPELPASAYFRRAREALDRSVSEGLIEVDFTDRHSDDVAADAANNSTDDSAAPYRLFGLLSPPAVTRPNRGAIYLTVNGRAVKDRTLTSALLEAFRHLLPPRRFPVAVLYLEVPGSDVDINVHPAKSEVRFRLPSRIYALFYHAVRTACGMEGRLQTTAPERVDPPDFNSGIDARTPPLSERVNRFPNYETPQPHLQSAVPARSVTTWNAQQIGAAWSRTFTGPKADLKFPSPGPLFSEPVPVPNPTASSDRHLDAPPISPDFDLWPKAVNAPNPSFPAESHSEPDSQYAAQPVQETPSENYGHSVPNAPPGQAADFRVIGQAAGSYIVVEDETGVRLIDQHALHERILFERLLAAAHAQSRGDSQGLLVPETVELSAVQAALVSSGSETVDLLGHLGFDCEPFGSRALLIRAIPAIVKASAGAAPARLVSDLLEALAAGDDAPNGGSKALKRWTLREKAAYILSCKAAIKAGERLTLDQMDALVTEFQTVAGPLQAGALTCPHGRPLALEISWYELERAVGRK